MLPNPCDPLSGGALPAGPNPCVPLLSINVTCLTKQRLITVLREASRVNAVFLCLQETRHSQAPGWAARLARGAGWKSAWSPRRRVKLPAAHVKVARLFSGGSLKSLRISLAPCRVLAPIGFAVGFLVTFASCPFMETPSSLSPPLFMEFCKRPGSCSAHAWLWEISIGRKPTARQPPLLVQTCCLSRLV